VHYPAPLEDVDAALAWVHRHIAQHGGDPARIVVGGHSAGGHLAAMSVLLEPAPASRGLVACFPVSAPLDIRYRDCAPDSPEARVYKYLLERREDDEQASPIVHAGRAKIPFHLAWGERDFTRILSANERFAAEMRRLGKSFTTQFDTGASHFDTHLALGDPAAPWYRALVAFKQNILGSMP
jgi:acetyl esterase/lipase